MNFFSAVSILLLALNGNPMGSAAEDKESCKINRKLHEQCGSYTYEVVRPLLGYVKELKMEVDNHDSKIQSKDMEIKELKEQMAQLQPKDNSNVAVMGELGDQIEIHKNNLQKFSLLIKSEISKLNSLNSEEFEKKIAEKSLEIEQKNIEIRKLEKVNSECSKLQKQVQDEVNICEAIVKLQNDIQKIPNSCIPFGDSPGVHLIATSNRYAFNVLCDSQTAGPGWTVIQQTIDRNMVFHRDWVAYREGFGSLNDNFFLGLERIHRLTTDQPHELYILMERFDQKIIYARYDQFAISGEYDDYRLCKLGAFSGNAINWFKEAINLKFSTYDRDNDEYPLNSASILQGGWWLSKRVTGNLDAIYYHSDDMELDLYARIVKMLIRIKK